MICDTVQPGWTINHKHHDSQSVFPSKKINQMLLHITSQSFSRHPRENSTLVISEFIQAREKFYELIPRREETSVSTVGLPQQTEVALTITTRCPVSVSAKTIRHVEKQSKQSEAV